MKIKNVLRFIGISLLMVSALMLVSGFVSLYYDKDDSMMPLFFSALLTAVTGILPLLFTSRGQKLTVREGYYVVVGSWLFACLFGMLPYLMYGGEFSFANALFEAVSGFTTSGASILNDIEALPRGLLFWRMSTAWVGGVGIVTIFSMLIPKTEEKSVLTSVEISGLAKEDAVGGKRRFANHLLIIYILLTLVTILSLKLAGMDWFDAVANAMSVCATCGFCTRNASIAAFDSPAIELVMIVAMIVASINFGLLFFSLFRGKIKKFFTSETVRCFFLLLTAAFVLVSINLLISNTYDGFWTTIRKSLFQVVSISTTSGFATTDTTMWPPLSILLLIICSIICGCSGSTSGGLKIDRVLLAGKAIKQRLVSLHNPRAVSLIKVNGVVKSKDMVFDVYNFVICYFVIVAIFALVNLAFGLDVTTGVTASVSCMGNVGPGFGTVGSTGNYAAFPSFLKFTSSFEMLIGRLEIFPLLYFLGVRKAA